MTDAKTIWTSEQKLAIGLRGKNLLVSASAGTGKTSVLVERIIAHLLSDDPVTDIERLLVVTFTEKAALEMKERVRASLEAAAEKNPGDTRLERQLSYVDRAHISTIHSFCLGIVRRYFYKVGLDPSFRVLDEKEAELLRTEALEDVFEEWYGRSADFWDGGAPENVPSAERGSPLEGDFFREGPIFRAGPGSPRGYVEDAARFFPGLVERYGGRGVDEDLKGIILRLHDFVRSQPSQISWLEHVLKDAARWLSDPGGKTLLRLPWTRVLLEALADDLDEAIAFAEEARRISASPGGPGDYLPLLERELAVYHEAKELALKAIAACESVSGATSEAVESAGLEALGALREISGYKHERLPGKKIDCDPELREKAKSLRDLAKRAFSRLEECSILRPAEELVEEMRKTLPYLYCLSALVADFDRKYSEKKLERGGLDFADLEKYCLEILTMDDGLLAEEVRKEFDYVLVDEYQDTNPVQEEILSIVSKPGNLFMVGDLKQSIYRFRLAEPGIFLGKLRRYSRVAEDGKFGPDAPGLLVELSRNFRSRREIIDAVNYVFEKIMTRNRAGIDYGAGHRLNAGASYPELSATAGRSEGAQGTAEGSGGNPYLAELHLVERNSVSRENDAATQGNGSSAGESGESPGEDPDYDPSADSEIEEYEALEKEALVVAAKIKELVDPERPFMIWDTAKKRARPCTYRDIAVLMRATRDRANAVLEIFQRCEIPSYCDLGTGYFRAREVEVALALLSVIDNPRQDIPLAAVLRSPVVGLEPRDLAIIRTRCRGTDFYDSVRDFARQAPDDPVGKTRESPGSEVLPTNEQSPGDLREVGSGGDNSEDLARIRRAVSDFLERLERWRTMARRLPLAEVLWTVLSETGYYDYVGGLPGGAQRQANLRALVDRAMEFDSFGRHGLFRFLRFIERLEETKGDLGTARALGEHEDVVRIISIHKAKGLEFPVVFLMDLGKLFNMEDTRPDILFHRDLGLCPMYCDLRTRVKYPTMAHAAASVRIRKENLAEEMRVLYVGMTRAREKLFLVGSARNLEKQKQKWKAGKFSSAQSYLDWLCPAILGEGEFADVPVLVKFWGTPGGQEVPQPFSRPAGESDLLWKDVRRLIPPPFSPDPKIYPEVRRRLEWRYSRAPFSQTLAKMSVQELKRRIDEDEEDYWRFIPSPDKRPGFLTRKAPGGVEKGTAVHVLLARMSLEKGGEEAGVRSEVSRLADMGLLDSELIDDGDVERIVRFFRSPTGRALSASPGKVKREVPFTLGVPVYIPPETRISPRGDPSCPSWPEMASRAPEPSVILDFGIYGGAAVPDGSGGLARETVVVQGVIDVLLEEDDGFMILDYKTDDLAPTEVPRAVRRYTPQVSLYALAVERILGKRVKRALLAFLGPGVEVEVDWKGYLSRARTMDNPVSRVM
ncbi:MAG TPA: UvrD-helicase domain-containing protein [Firmicutes bacterium]|nr:UvrD-helicase domain-containing protein [Candidatus Fermentithermobacillaceae bacterium]